MMEISKRKLAMIIGSGVLALVLLITIIGGISIVDTGTTGVKVWLGSVDESEVFEEGFHIKAPFMCTIVEMDNKVQKVDVDANSTSKDLQNIDSTLSINFHLAPEKSASMYKNVGKNYVDTLLQPAIQEAAKNVMAQYRAEELITSRSKVGSQIQEEISNKINEYGILIDKFNITNFNFSKAFNDAIEQKLVAEQNKIKARTENEQRVAAAEADAAEAKARAEGDAESQRIKAKGEADAIKAKAEAEAEANELLNKSISDNVLTYKQIEAWDGKYPTVMSGDDGSHIIIDTTK